MGRVWVQTGPSLSHKIPSCSRPRFSPRWAQTVTEKPYPSPPSELPPLEETGGQWLAWDAKGRDCLSFINGKDLKDVTNNVHYENYRSKKLAAVTCNGVDTSKTRTAHLK
ncbi:septin-7-like protein [Lates japonicus]|uniref:Septin-7-like protein n=1 Tax=Lates japonicus TaxID=270547 RepID=A0AAD3RGH4_LATJO|nr:septin-7-like protein [Lates japonicus]